MNFLATALTVLLTASFTAAALRGNNDNNNNNNNTNNVRRHLLPAGTECVAYVKLMEYEDGHHEQSFYCQFDPDDAKRFGGDTMIEIESGSNHELFARGAISGESVLRVGSLSYVEERGDNIFSRDSYDSVEPTSTSKSSTTTTTTTTSAVLHFSKDEGFDIEMMDEFTDSRHHKNRKARRQRHRRDLTQSLGVLNTLVVRVVDDTSSGPFGDAARLENDIFTDDHCLKSQYDECSHGNIEIQQATEVSSTVNGDTFNGIIDIPIDSVASGTFYKTVEKEAYAATASYLVTEANDGTTLNDAFEPYDLVMFCQPPGTVSQAGNGWVAYAYVNGFTSFYSDAWCGYVSAQMHEIGHNLGLGHSGFGAKAYGDKSGVMGFSSATDDGPGKCFNAAKSYQLNWYPDQVGSVNPLELPNNGSQEFVLNGVADYQKNTNALVSLRLEYEGNIYEGKDWYIGYSRKNGITNGAIDEADKVHLIEKTNLNGANGFNGYGPSMRIATLAATESFTWMIGDAEVTLRVDNFTNNNRDAIITLTGPPPLSTQPPTASPTTSPTASPMAPPPASPTAPPTASPTASSTTAETCANQSGKYEINVSRRRTKRKNCAYVGKQNKRKTKKLCKTNISNTNTKVFDVCKETCGLVGLGECKALKTKK